MDGVAGANVEASAEEASGERGESCDSGRDYVGAVGVVLEER